jgi:hypothetical protein
MILKIFTFALKAVSVVPFFLFGMWLLQVVYFSELKGTSPAIATPVAKEDDIFGEILAHKRAVSRGHFHMVDEWVTRPEPRPPLCLTCHGTYPHSKEKKIRGFLNFHTGYIACSVCHLKERTGKLDIAFAWVDRQAGAIATMGEGGYGKYTGKLYPIKISDKGQKTIFRPVSEKAAEQYLELKDKFTPDQVAQAKVKLHESVSDKPVLCDECHKKDGYLDFADLGFPKERAIHLVSGEVPGMIEKYETFYLPSVIDFAGDGLPGKQ